MRALNRKLIRDLVHMRGQALAIALVIACGVATFVMSVSTLHSLSNTKSAYEDQFRFPHVFAHLKRAPKALARRIEEIPGVESVISRVVVDVNLDVPGMVEPALGRLISLGPRAQEGLSRLYLRRGRFVEPGHAGEVLASESFVQAHDLEPGDSIVAIINGRRQELRIVGVALSTEYIYSIRPGDILPDDRRFGVFWMEDRQLSSAFDMEGAFNDVALSLRPGASEAEVIRSVDALTERYGGLGAYGRDEQASNQFVTNEIRELTGMALIVPTIFLAVAAFLLHVVISRVVQAQREQIAALKAFGYLNRQIALHYLALVMWIVLVGVVIGVVAGSWLGRSVTQMYTRFFHFPVFEFSLDARVLLSSLGLSAGSGIAATLGAVRRAGSLPPAEAMRPEPPAVFRPTVVERIGLQRLLPASARMILRQLERRPFKAFLSCVGIAMAAAVLVLGSYMLDAINEAIEIEFVAAQRQDIMVTFVEPASGRAVADLGHLPGVELVEPFRAVSARLVAGHRSRRVAILGLPAGRDLLRLIDLDQNVIELPPEGLVVSAKLAELLDLRVGDSLVAEVLEQSRPLRELRLAGVINDFAGLSAYMDLDALHRLMREQDAISGAYIAADPRENDRLYRELKTTPRAAGVTLKTGIVESFRNIVAENLLRMRMFNIIFACIIAVGVVYNTVRISLAERARELATLRVIGFTRAEVSMLLLGELGVLTLLAVPGGLLMGYGFAALTSLAYNTELFRVPLVVEPATYGFAAAMVIAAAVGSGLVVRRRVDHLDLPAVLKAAD